MIVTQIATARRWFVLALCLFASAAAGGLHAQSLFPDFGGFEADSSSSGEVSVSAEFTAPAEGRPALLFVTVKIPEGHHIYAVDQKEGGPVATEIFVGQTKSTMQIVSAWQPLQAPSVHVDNDIWVGLEIREHTGEVTWFTPLNIAPNTDLSKLTLYVNVVGQSCTTGTCLPFEEKITARLGEGMTLPAKVSTSNSVEAEETSSDSMLLILGYGILGGLILNLMPCVLPVIGLKVLGFAEQGGQSRSRILMLNLSYVAGLMAVFMMLATLAAMAQLGLGEESFGWGELYTLTPFKVAMAALVFAMALSFLGIWELPIPGFATSDRATELAAQEGPGGAFCMGMFTTLLATPCSGPFLGPVFGYTISQPSSVIYAIFASVGLGMALPYLLIGFFPSLVSWLPKPGAWMDTLKHLMGFVLLGTVVYLFSTLNHHYFVATLALLFAIWFGCWIIGSTSITATFAQKRNAWLGGTTFASVVGYLAFSLLTPSASALPWQPYSPQALAEARAEGKTVLVDFSANWCPTCKLNLKVAINRKDVKDWVEENGIVTLLADWTDRNETIKQALLELNSKSIPLLAIYPADASRPPIVLPDLLTKKRVLGALAEAGPSVGFEGDTAMATSPKAPEFGSLIDRDSTVR